MSNEKPVRITVGDVKEVTEATTIQAETSAPRSVSSVSYTASVPDTSGNAIVYGAGFIGFLLLVGAGYFGLGQSPSDNSGVLVALPKPPGLLGRRPMGGPGANAAGNNAPTATNAPAKSEGTPAPADASNMATSNNAPETSNNSPASTNTQAANNGTK